MDGPLAVLGHDWQRRSLVRLPRQLLEACLDLLYSAPLFRPCLKVALNSSLEPLGPDEFLLLRPGRWAADPEGPAIAHLKPSIARIQVRPPLASWLLENLSGSPIPLQELLRSLRQALGGDPSSSVDELLRLGFLLFEPPWATDDPNLEARLLEHLQPWAATPEMGELMRILAEIVSLEAGFPARPHPEACLAACRDLTDELWRRTVDFGGSAVPCTPPKGDRSTLHEDVFLVPDSTASPTVAHVALGVMQRQLCTLRPLLRLASLYDRSRDFLFSLGASCRAQWPGREELPLLQVVRSALPLWRQFVEDEREVANSREPRAPAFNPLRLDRLRELGEARDRCTSQLASCLEAFDGEARVAGDRLGRLLDGLPDCDEVPRAVCLFLQPVGDRWFLNRVREGGRHHSRHLAVMGDSAGVAVSERYRCRSVLEHRGERMEILDLLCSAGSALNVHPAQTARVLELPGERSSRPAGQRLTLQDLRLRLPPSGGLPFLTDREGGRVLPLHAGAMLPRFLPLLVQFLRLFGPCGVDLVLPALEPRRQGDVRLRSRLVIGDLILERCRWTVPAGEICRRTETLSPARAFAAVNRWRMARGIPDRAFLPRPPGSLRIQDKPVYIDFTSPVFVDLFRESLSTEADIVLEEVLPAIGDGIPDAAGERWAVELQLDSLLFPGSLRIGRKERS